MAPVNVRQVPPDAETMFVKEDVDRKVNKQLMLSSSMMINRDEVMYVVQPCG